VDPSRHQCLDQLGRQPTVNFGRIAGVKSATDQDAASDAEVDFFQLHRKAYDAQTGLNRYDDEKLIRSREAMILAVQIFNNPWMKFKAEVFCVLSNIAWTYLLHEYYSRKTTVDILDASGFSIPLSQMIDRSDCPLSDGIRNNLRAVKVLRDKVEHHLLGKGDAKWLGIFQACCLNFDKTICEFFGSRLTLAADLAFALQFAKPNLEQAAVTNKYELPPAVDAIDAQIAKDMTAAQLDDIEFQFQVIYTLATAPKSKAHIQFVKPDSAEGKQIHNVLTKKVIADEDYPYKPGILIKLIKSKTKQSFTSHTHQQAIRLYKVRPRLGDKEPHNTDKAHCIYHSAHRDYTYSKEWLKKLIEAVNDPAELARIRAVKLYGALPGGGRRNPR
jgi:hypothetical protein